MWRLLMATALTAVVLSALSASAALLTVQPGHLAVFTYPVDIEALPSIEDCDDNCGDIESTAEDGENPGEDLPTEYEVEPGDTLWDIGRRFGTTVGALAQINDLEDPTMILYGSTLSVPCVGENPESNLPEAGPEKSDVPPAAHPPLPPVPTAEYEVKPGETLWDISRRFDTTVQTLAELNGLENPATILYGSTLNVPYVGEELGDATADVSP